MRRQGQLSKRQPPKDVTHLSGKAVYIPRKANQVYRFHHRGRSLRATNPYGCHRFAHANLGQASRAKPLLAFTPPINHKFTTRTSTSFFPNLH
jgi:hypothetical protein